MDTTCLGWVRKTCGRACVQQYSWVGSRVPYKDRLVSNGGVVGTGWERDLSRNGHTLSRLRSYLIWKLGPLLYALPGGGGGGGTRLLKWIGGCRWGFRTWPCHIALGARKMHPVIFYLTKNIQMHTLLQYCTPQIYHVSVSLIGGAELTSKKKKNVLAFAWIAGLSYYTMGMWPCDKRSSLP